MYLLGLSQEERYLTAPAFSEWQRKLVQWLKDPSFTRYIRWFRSLAGETLIRTTKSPRILDDYTGEGIMHEIQATSGLPLSQFLNSFPSPPMFELHDNYADVSQPMSSSPPLKQDTSMESTHEEASGVSFWKVLRGRLDELSPALEKYLTLFRTPVLQHTHDLVS